MTSLKSTPMMAVYPSIKNKVAIVTGAAGGIGNAIASELWSQGAHVIATDIVPITSDYQERFTIVVGDITQSELQNELLSKSKALGGVDILVNNAAIVNFDSAMRIDPPEHETQDVFSVNFHAPRILGHAAAKQMMDLDKNGSIIFITSVHALLVRMQEHYHATKAAMEALMREMAVQYGPDGIRVNAVAPGAIHTGDDQSDATLRKGHFRMQTPLGRKGSPREVANAVSFLASDAASYITGTTLYVDGGVSDFNWITKEYLKDRFSD